MKKLRVGVIGIGDISNVYLNNLKKYDAVEVVACASRGLEKAQRKAAEHGIPKAYASGMELIADPDIDIILNLTTPQAHYEYNLAALKAGKHVYTEKPLAMSTTMYTTNRIRCSAPSKSTVLCKSCRVCMSKYSRYSENGTVCSAPCRAPKPVSRNSAVIAPRNLRRVLPCRPSIKSTTTYSSRPL